MKMATWAEVNGKVGTHGTPLAKCPTMREVVNAGSHIHIKESYSANKLVTLDEVTKLTENVISFEMWSSSTIRWSSQYALASTIIAHIEYVDQYIQTCNYDILMSSGKSGDREELPSPMREFKSVYINVKNDSAYYYEVKKY